MTSIAGLPLLASLIGVLLGAVATYALQVRLKLFTLRAEYVYEQRKALRLAMGTHHGRILQACRMFDTRMMNLYRNPSSDWLTIDESYPSDHHYFMSTLYRFLALMTYCYQFERSAIFVDQRIGEHEVLDFVHYVARLIQVATDVTLFRNVPYDTTPPTPPRDHFLRDQLLGIVEHCIVDGALLEYRQLPEALHTVSALRNAAAFLNGASPEEGRLRWDRLVCLHVVVKAFMATFGYEHQRVSDRELVEVCSHIRHAAIRSNLASIFRDMPLTKRNQRVRSAIVCSLSGIGDGGQALSSESSTPFRTTR